MKQFIKRTNKESQPRRRPESGRDTASFASYYASKRSNIVSKSKDSVARNSAPVSTLSSRLKKLTNGASVDTLLQRLGRIALGVVLLVCLVSLLQIDNNPRIVMLNNEADEYELHTISDYQQVITNNLRSSLFNSNKVTINTHGVVAVLQESFPEIYDASVVLPLVGHRPTVYIELAQPAVVLRTASTSATLDNSGRALLLSSNTTATSASTARRLPIITDTSDVQPKVGEIALSSSTVAFVKDVVRQFDSQHIGITKMVLPAGKEELDVYPAKTSYYVRFNLHETSSREQAGTYFATLQQIQNKPGAVKPKQYIDVRLVGRAYVL